jgi:hypothetical protein
MVFFEKIKISTIKIFKNFDFIQKQQTRCANCAPWGAEQHCQ